jgi:thiol-disulfide isomerase/thioredoxin
MKTVFKFIASTTFVVSFTFGSAFSKPVKNDRFPDIKFQLNATLNELTFKNEFFKNKMHIIEFCASWCTSCKTTMLKVFEAIKSIPSIQFFPISVDEDLDSAKKYFSDLPNELAALKLNTLYDKDTDLATKLKIEGLPTTILIGADGVFLYVIEGYPTDKQINELKNLVELEARKLIK